jgi:hypothetical protein
MTASKLIRDRAPDIHHQNLLQTAVGKMVPVQGVWETKLPPSKVSKDFDLCYPSLQVWIERRVTYFGPGIERHIEPGHFELRGHFELGVGG